MQIDGRDIQGQITSIEIDSITVGKPPTLFLAANITAEDGNGSPQKTGWLVLDEPMARSLVEMLQSKLPPLAPSAVPPSSLQ